MASLPDHSTERTKHDSAIASLAAQTGIDVGEVSRVYETVLSRLTRGAHLREFMPLLAARHTRETLRRDRP